MDIQLFDKHGGLVTTVRVPSDGGIIGPEIVTWGGRYYRLESGRYVESTMFVSTEARR